MTQCLELTLSFGPSSAPHPDHIVKAIAKAIASFGARLGWTPTLVHRVTLVLEELVSNIVMHGRRTETQRTPEIDIAIEQTEAAVKIAVSDDGKGFDPVDGAPPPPAIDSKEIEVGGLGLQIVRGYAQTMAYARRQGRNRLELTVAQR